MFCDRVLFRAALIYLISKVAISTSEPVTTTEPITTTPVPTTMPGGCLVDGQFYSNGKDIYRAKDGCYGSYCEDGGQVHWDHKCYFYTPACSGVSEKLSDQCCPICHESDTTVPMTTTPPRTTTPGPPDGSCVVDGKVYRDGEDISRAEDGCYGLICMEGHQVPWDHACMFKTPACDGVLEKLSDQCCPICHNTTTVPQITNKTSSHGTTLTTYNPDLDCSINGSWISNGTVTMVSPCKTCTCVLREEVCAVVKCDVVLDCADFYTPPGECCATCGIGIMQTWSLFQLTIVYSILTMFLKYGT